MKVFKKETRSMSGAGVSMSNFSLGVEYRGITTNFSE